MTYNPEIHYWRPIRLQGYDYSKEGIYLVIICIQGHECLLEDIINIEVILNHSGEMIKSEREKIQERYSNIEVDKYMLMPDRLLSIIIIKNNKNAGTFSVNALPEKI